MQTSPSPKPPLTEILKSIPEVFGIRLNEEPKYTLLKKDGAIEIRQYPPLLLAQYEAQGDHKFASSEGFRHLAAYIFGENHGHSELAMTAPVMTAPVLKTPTATGWTISFVLPNSYTLKSAPKPKDPAIRLVEASEQTVAVYTFSGVMTDAAREKAAAKLSQWLRIQELGKPEITFAQYDPPFAIPFLRKNEARGEITTGRKN